MRWLDGVVVGIMLASVACDKTQEDLIARVEAKADSGATGLAAASAPSPSPATATANAGGDAGDEAGAKAPATPMPERPVPRPQTMVRSGMPIEVQQKAISYMVAMRAPHLDDVPADTSYANDLIEKLKPITLSMDTGANKARFNRVELVANGRQIDLLMAGGCDEKTPARAVVSRAGIPLSTLVSHGVLVVRCNDVRVQCLQSTRDPSDVLCTTAPRHK